jgi:1-acylglycerone phosphate reductase
MCLGKVRRIRFHTLDKQANQKGAYAASKSAMEVIADTLRVELAPLGVRVVSVVTTGVKSQGHTGYQMWKMPSDSRYLQVQTNFVKRAKGDDGAPRMEAMEYAKRVVEKVLGSEKRKIWCGAYAGMLKWMIAWLPMVWLVRIRCL